MEPLLIALIPGVFGGLFVAWLIAVTRRALRLRSCRAHLAAPTPALINMAHIQVEGVGGLGMVAAVIAVAIADPRIRLAILIAWVFGTALAIALIVARRRNGALPSGGGSPDDRSTLHLEPRPAPHTRGTTPGVDGLRSDQRSGGKSLFRALDAVVLSRPIIVQANAVAGMPLRQQHDLSAVIAEVFDHVEHGVEDGLIEPLRPAPALEGRVGRIGGQLPIEL